VRDKLVDVFAEDELAELLATCKGSGFQNRSDYVVILLFKDAGVRLSELACLAVADASPVNREVVGTGEGDKQRTMRFTYGTSRALDRYLRERTKHPWRESRHCGLTYAAAPCQPAASFRRSSAEASRRAWRSTRTSSGTTSVIRSSTGAGPTAT
jgi:site-specific recombinase XerD